MELKDLMMCMEEAMNRYDLSDESLEERECPPRTIGEFQYGVASVPCSWVYPYLVELSRLHEENRVEQ